jgi:5-oxoprolinase (ATP-hydrolysing) subunit A
MSSRGEQRLRTVDLNADVGETEGDLALLAVVTSASIACGLHAGDPSTMRRTVSEAVRRGVVLGAHASYADRDGFGRRELGATCEQIVDDVCYQIGALQAIARLEGGSVGYVKLHGALYHRAAVDEDVAVGLARALGAIGSLAVLAEAGSALLRACQEAGLAIATEAFCDRAYRPDGKLVDRSMPGAVLDDPARAAAQAVGIALSGTVTASDGSVVAIEATSLCLHGDTPGSLEQARQVRAALERAGVRMSPFLATRP